MTTADAPILSPSAGHKASFTGLHSDEPYGVPMDWSQRQRSVYWSGPPTPSGTLLMVDQRHLPHQISTQPHHTLAEVVSSIKSMLVRGAPAIGAAGAFGLILAAFQSPATTSADLLSDLTQAKAALDAARPTAVNLSWATSRIVALAHLMHEEGIDMGVFRTRLHAEAQQLADDDVRINKLLGDYGAAILPPPRHPPTLHLLHHCNTGALATVDYGTALGVIYSAFHQRRHPIHVWVDETRPRLQGARLTAYELMREGVDMSLIVDSAAGLLMWQGKVDCLVFGADRVAANGDTANKVGTYKAAVCAWENDVPVYACVPTPTIDLTLPTGRLIPIEERDAREVTHPQSVDVESIAPAGVRVFNPAFDVTPAKYISAIVTEEGVCYPPFEVSLKEAKDRAERRVREDWKRRAAEYLKK